MTYGHLFALQDPFVHTPEMSRFNVKAEGIDNARDQRELFSGSDWTADAHWVVVGALAPGIHIFERLGKVEFLERIVEDHLKPGTREAFEIARFELSDSVDQVS